MKRKLLYIILLLISLFPSMEVKANKDFLVLSDSTQVSLLTNSAWNKEVYALFGHTAIRVQDFKRNLDFVFNYGVFDFNSPSFMWRFMTGETDYVVAGYETIYYLTEYELRGVEVKEQVLNLSQEEKQNIWTALLMNVQTEGWTYRYNFVYDNCTTRARDILEKNINGSITHTPTSEKQTYRDLIHECVNSKPWIRFGIDLIIGRDADKTINDRQKDFLPKYMMNAYRGAIMKAADGTEKDWVTKEYILLEASEDNIIANGIPTDYPLIVGFILLIVAILISYLAYKKNALLLSKAFDTILFLIAGFIGYIIFFLIFFSEHPCVNPNWNIVWLQPLHLIVACLFFVKPLTKYIYYYHFINFVVLSVFLLAWGLIPQQLEIAFIPYFLAIWLRFGMNVLTIKKTRKQTGFLFMK